MTLRKQKEDYPNAPRSMDYNEVMQHTHNLATKIAASGATQIIGVHRSGLPFATWIAQELQLPLGIYFPADNTITVDPNTPKFGKNYFAFVDETAERGTTLADAKLAIERHRYRRDIFFQNCEYLLSSVFIDHFHPTKDTMYAYELDFWCDGIAGVNKHIAVAEPHWRNK